ncbi:MAG TPA: ADP-forming succinate--CoA ligase subunit beta [Candidatus Dormibacteraeota bacterium]|nr:ADP-forming succinate--CoA ligase subunit beta [Candidatus Dormibacteraeota bacterium]
MKLQEYRSKEILARYGVPLLAGEVATTPPEARAAAARIGGPVVVKAQVLVGGRGKAGGVKLAANPEEAEQRAREIIGLDIKGVTVRTLLVAPAADIAREYYLGVILDRSAKAVTIIASAEGGVEIEQTARTNPEAILRLALDPLIGLQEYQVRRVGFFLGIPAELRRDFGSVLRGLGSAFFESDADLAEINPLVVTDDGRLLALDAKIVLDDSALPRHPGLEAMRDLNEEEPAETAAREAGISFIKLDGTIGCMVNGAGLAMTTMDLVKLAGGEPANFLDIGGGAKADRVAAAFRIILGDPNVRAILVNIFGGITRGDEVAHGIVEARSSLTRDVPMVVRIVGTNAAQAAEILRQANLITADSLDDAAAKAVAAASAAPGSG